MEVKKGPACRQAGFTLVELMVAVAIVATVGTMIVNLFLANLRAAAKTRALTETKQNGDYAISVMNRMIRNAKKVENYSPSSIEIKNPDDETTEFKCESEKISSNSAALISENIKVVSDCNNFFTYEAPVGKPMVVKIQFTLTQKESSLGKEFTVESLFETTVSTRTY